MRHAYALLGLAFIIVFGGAYVLIEHAYAPTVEDDLADNLQQRSMSLSLTSPAFRDGEVIPSRYTCDGENINPPLTISGVPDGTQSLVLVMDDPDIPNEVKEARGIEKFNHWAVYNLPVDTTEIPEATSQGSFGINDGGGAGYTGPCPPSQYTPTEHRYVFRLYAIGDTLTFDTPPSLDALELRAISLQLERAMLIGRYERK